MQAKAAKFYRTWKEKPTTTRLPVLGENQVSLVSATTRGISSTQVNLNLVPWWKKKLHQNSMN